MIKFSASCDAARNRFRLAVATFRSTRSLFLVFARDDRDRCFKAISLITTASHRAIVASPWMYMPVFPSATPRRSSPLGVGLA